MSKLRGQGRLLVLIAAGVLVVYVMYNFMGKSSVSAGTRSFKDNTVLKYHQLAGKVDLHAGADKAWNRPARPNTHREMVQEAVGHAERAKEPGVNSEQDQPRPDEPMRRVNPGNLEHEQDELEDGDGDLEEEEEDAGEMEELRRRAQLQKPNDDSQVDTLTTKAKSNRKKFSAFVSVTEPEPFPLYTDPDTKYTQFFAGQMRLVHLDLKGAPPNMSYLAQLFPLFSKMGATGLLMEYEDTFPYSQQLHMLSAKYAYTKENIEQINNLAKVNKLQIIPLVQTFGHMEFVLKSRSYRTLREQDETPQIISPKLPASMLVISAMIEQVKALHPGIKYFHIGCDEVYQLGKGSSKKFMEEKHWTVTQLFFSHVRKVVDEVRRLGLTPIMWDDMFRKLNMTDLQESGLGGLVEPMIWQYSPQPQRSLPVDIWHKYGKVFKNVWVASSFKGATGSSQYITDATIHLENHLNWVEIMKQYGADPSRRYVTFKGIVLTGWQRYDHFATLCELLPVALPSLAVCLQTMQYGYFNEEMHGKISQTLLQCDHMLELRLQNEPDGTSNCKFPGSEVFYSVQKLYSLHQRWEHYSMRHRMTGWISSYNMKYNFSSPGQMGVILPKLNHVREELIELRQNMSNSLSELFDQYTVAEFLDVQIEEFVREASKIIMKAKSLAARRVWPRRPLLDNAEEEEEDMNNPQLKLAIGGEEAANVKSNEEEKSRQKSNDPNGLGKPNILHQSTDVRDEQNNVQHGQNVKQTAGEQNIPQREIGQDVQRAGDGQIKNPVKQENLPETGQNMQPGVGNNIPIHAGGEQMARQGAGQSQIMDTQLRAGQDMQNPKVEQRKYIQFDQLRAGQNNLQPGNERNMPQQGVGLKNQLTGMRYHMQPQERQKMPLGQDKHFEAGNKIHVVEPHREGNPVP